MNKTQNDLKMQNVQPPTPYEHCPWCHSAISHSQFEEIETKIRQQEQVKLADSAKEVRAQLEAQHAAELTRQRQQNEQQLETVVQAKLKALDTERQKMHSDQVAAIQKDRDESILKAQSEFNRERESLQLKIKEVERQLQKKSAGDLGDGAEIDLYEAMRVAFPGDRVTRIPKGEPGADIHFEVIYKGQSCGKIILESKNTKTWQTSFVSKLRQDQINAGAHSAILATTAFPGGHRDLCVLSDVIVVSPTRVNHIIAILRRSIIAIHLRGLSLHERANKMSKLHSLISSAKYVQQFREVEKLTTDIENLDGQERRAHETLWKKRGGLATRITNALREIDSDIASVIEGEDQTELSVAS